MKRAAFELIFTSITSVLVENQNTVWKCLTGPPLHIWRAGPILVRKEWKLLGVGWVKWAERRFQHSRYQKALRLARVWNVLKTKGSFLSVKWVKSLSCVRLFVTPWTVAYQAPPSMGFSRQECWSGLPFPSPGDLPDPGIKPGSPASQADALPSESPGKPPY